MLSALLRAGAPPERIEMYRLARLQAADSREGLSLDAILEHIEDERPH